MPWFGTAFPPNAAESKKPVVSAAGGAARKGAFAATLASQFAALDDEELVGGEECAERRPLFEGRVSTIDSTAGLQDVHVDEAIRVLSPRDA